MTGRAIVIPLLMLFACQEAPKVTRSDDNQTYGDILMLADADFRDVLEDERRMFEATYERARLLIRYLPERELTTAMLNDSVRVVFSAFAPGAEQQAYFKTRNLTPHIEAICTDAIAVLLHPANPIDSLTLDHLRAILSGTAPDDLSELLPLFEGPGSGTARTLVDSLFHGEASRMKNAAAANGVDDMLARVARDPSAIAFISWSRISDLDDPAHRALRANAKICRIGSPGQPALLPSQSTLADGHYPLRRELQMMVVEGKSGLGTGFASFVAGHKGQRIILKQGLAPRHVPAREVMIVNE